MKFNFNYQKFKRNIKTLFSYLLPWIGFSIVLFLFAVISEIIEKNAEANPFYFKTIGDYLLILEWLFSGIIPILFVFLAKKEPYQTISKMGLIAAFTFISTLVPLPLMWKYFGNYITQQDVNKVISNTILTYIVFIVALIVGYFVTLTVSRKIIKKNNWWMLIFAMPYIIFYWIIASKYSQFHNFVSSSNYKSSKVALMVNSSKNPNIMLMNEFWYEIITLVVIVLVIELGVIVFAFLQEKISEKKERC